MLFRRGDDPNKLFLGMTGVQLGDRVLQIGCAHGGRLGALASKVGLTGRALVVVPDDASASRARKGAADRGALVEIEVAPPGRLPAENDAFDLVVIDDTGSLFASLRAEERVATVREALRVLRPAGRVMVIGTAPRGGLGALLNRTLAGAPFDPVPSLTADGFRSARAIAEREGLIFTEAVKPR